MTNEWSAFWHFLDLEEIEENHIFRGNSIDFKTGRVYGGQVFAQAIAAARKTVDKDRRLHSANAYFLRYGDDREPIVFMVENTRDGRSYSSRTVTALQKGRPIFSLSCSYASVEDSSLNFSCDVPFNSEDIPKMREIDLTTPARNEIRSLYRAGRLGKWPLVMRFLEGDDDCYRPDSFYGLNIQHTQSIERLDATAAVLGFISDFGLLPSTMRSVHMDEKMEAVTMATVSHSMWVHHPIELGDWMYIHTKPHYLGGGRALVRGSIYSADGQLLATLMQEGVVRMKKDQ